MRSSLGEVIKINLSNFLYLPVSNKKVRTVEHYEENGTVIKFETYKN